MQRNILVDALWRLPEAQELWFEEVGSEGEPAYQGQCARSVASCRGKAEVSNGEGRVVAVTLHNVGEASVLG